MIYVLFIMSYYLSCAQCAPEMQLILLGKLQIYCNGGKLLLLYDI